MKKVFIILILILLTWLGYQAFIFLVPPKYCVKISGGWDYPLEDWAIKKNIKVALDLIKEHSSQDYERLCVYGPRIQLTGAPVLDSARPVSFGAAGHYIDRHYSTPEGQGLITINRAYAHDLLLLSEVIVHETCHAYLIQTQQDYREEPCYQRGWEHVARIPETIKNLLQPSDEPTPVVAFSVYCGDDKKIGANSIAGYCVFANNSDQSETPCAQVFLGDETDKIDAQKICASLEPGQYQRQIFTLTASANYSWPQFEPAIKFMILDSAE